MPPASHQVSATSLKLLIQQIHPHVRVERDLQLQIEDERAGYKRNVFKIFLIRNRDSNPKKCMSGDLQRLGALKFELTKDDLRGGA
jgi:hypothetical protein